MRVLIAPDRFAGSGETGPLGPTGPLSAAEAAEAIATGWTQTCPYDTLDVLPLSDGGPGFIDVLHEALGGDISVVTVRGPLGPRVPARVLVVDGTAYVEAAEAVGLHLVPAEHRDPVSATAASTAGVADLVTAALETGAGRLVVGVGGTATTDGGRGLVEALGGLAAARARLGGPPVASDGPGGVELVVATATDAPLMGHSGAAHGFAAGKGADRAARDRLEARLRQWATDTDGGLAVRPGAGAGGGLGFGLLLLGATRVNGAELVADRTGLPGRVAAADLALTGQSVFDWESLRGRVVVTVARAAQQAGRPTVVLAERVEAGRRELATAGIDAAYALEDLPGTGTGTGTGDGLDGDDGHSRSVALARLARRVARTWSR